MDPLMIQDAVMDGVARYQKWEREFKEAATETAVRTQLAIAFATMTPDQKEQLKQSNPEDYEKMMQFMKSGASSAY